MDTDHKRIDWSQLWYPGRKTPFTDQELARGGRDSPSPTLIAVAAVNVALISLIVLLLSPAGQIGRLAALLTAMVVVSFAVARRLWRNPWRRPLLIATLSLAFALGVITGVMHWSIPNRTERQAVTTVIAICAGLVPVLLWFLAVWRANLIEGRLRELAERERAMEMARRLAAAQIEPHFLFNTLAALQHWVQTKDDRATTLLDSLTGYLRATLPMFDRPLLSARDELLAVRRYLEVMRARMGERVSWSLDVTPDAAAALLPPGMLLTLVENAVVHGIEPQLAGGCITVTGRREGVLVRFVVADNGAGPPTGMRDGVGLSNIRQRLALACGEAAHLDVAPAPQGGCRAELQLHYREEVAA